MQNRPGSLGKGYVTTASGEIGCPLIAREKMIRKTDVLHRFSPNVYIAQRKFMNRKSDGNAIPGLTFQIKTFLVPAVTEGIGLGKCL